MLQFPTSFPLNLSISSVKESATALLASLWNGHRFSRIVVAGTVAVVCCLSYLVFNRKKASSTPNADSVVPPLQPVSTQKPFNRLTTISTENQASYTELKIALGKIPNLRFEFDDKKKSFHFENYGEEIIHTFDTEVLRPFFYATGFNHIFRHDVPIINAMSRKSFYYHVGPEAKTNELIEEANVFFQSVQEKRPIVTSAANKDIIDHLFVQSHFSGLIVGEYHNHSSPKKFIIDNLDKLKLAGVTTLFMEHLFHETMQPLLDAQEMSPILDSYLKYLDRGNKIKQGQPGFHHLITAAKAAGIRVVAIDSRDAYKSNIGNSGFGTIVDDTKSADRYKTMNYVASTIIEREKGEGKFIALVGSAHMTTCEQVLGLSEILGCPNVLVEDADSDSITWNIPNHREQLGHVHALVSCTTT